MNIVKKLEGIHHIYYVSDIGDAQLIDVVVAVFKEVNRLKSWPWPGSLPESRKKLRELEKQGALRRFDKNYLDDNRMSLDIEPKGEMWIQIGKKPLFTIIRFIEGDVDEETCLSPRLST